MNHDVLGSKLNTIFLHYHKLNLSGRFTETYLAPCGEFAEVMTIVSLCDTEPVYKKNGIYRQVSLTIRTQMQCKTYRFYYVDLADFVFGLHSSVTSTRSMAHFHTE